MSKELDAILKSLKVLYIEDEAMIRESVTTTLEVLCKEVVTADDAPLGLELFQTHKPDIIISDINMPTMTGLELVKIIREQNSAVPIILLTAHTDKEYLLEAIKLQLVEYLVKPVDFSMLHDALLLCAKKIVESGGYVLNFPNGLVYHVLEKYIETKETHRIELTKTECALLDLLILNKNRLTSADEIFANLYDYEDTSNPDSAIKALIYKLRNKIGKESLLNTSGLGYQLAISR